MSWRSYCLGNTCALRPVIFLVIIKMKQKQFCVTLFMKNSIDDRNIYQNCVPAKNFHEAYGSIYIERLIDTVSVVHVGEEAYEWCIYRVKKKRKVNR